MSDLEKLRETLGLGITEFGAVIGRHYSPIWRIPGYSPKFIYIKRAWHYAKAKGIKIDIEDLMKIDAKS